MSAAQQPRVISASAAVAVLLAALVLVVGCGDALRQPTATTAKPQAHSSSARSAAPRTNASATPALTVSIGLAGHYQVGERQMTFTEPAHVGVTGERLGERSLLTVIRYPVTGQSSGSWAAGGPFPLIMFAPGFQQCSGTYGHLLQTWASAGYVVAAVDFPRTSCLVGKAAYEPDLVNQPGDVSYVLSQLLALNAQPGDFLSSRLNPYEVAAAGQSDGGDTVAALGGNTCCRNYQFKAVAVLSGAEWPPMPGTYFAGKAPPMLFVQGNADTINPPWTSVQLYRADTQSPRYYLNLYGADHMVPYEGDNPVERFVARITLEFFGLYVLGDTSDLATMTKDARTSSFAALGSGGVLPSGVG